MNDQSLKTVQNERVRTATAIPMVVATDKALDGVVTAGAAKTQEPFPLAATVGVSVQIPQYAVAAPALRLVSMVVAAAASTSAFLYSMVDWKSF